MDILHLAVFPLAGAGCGQNRQGRRISGKGAAAIAAQETFHVTDLERSHAELRAALLLAGKRIVQLNFGKSKRDDPVLKILRKVLREARTVARQEASKKE